MRAVLLVTALAGVARGTDDGGRDRAAPGSAGAARLLPIELGTSSR